MEVAVQLQLPNLENRNPEISTPRSMFGVGNRRYLGSKSRLLHIIQSVIVTELGRVPQTVFDIFAGSGVVGCHFASLGSRVVMNDILKHNSLAHETFLLHMHYSREDLSELLNEMEQTKPVYGYTTRTFGGRYFSRENAMRLDAWLDFAHDGRLPSLVRSALLTSVIYAADKVALTVGHYDAFLKGARSSTSAKLLMPESIGVGTGHTVLNEDANVVVGQVETEVLYLDPPYNSRQYSDTYHVLENLACWQKPDVYGVSRKMDRTHLKSPYSGRRAGEAFAALVEDAKADLIVLSYSNTGNSRIARSNNVLSDRDIMKVLNSRGRVRVETLSHREFSAGKTSARDHAERLFICRVGQK